MSIDTVKEYFASFGREGDVLEFTVSSATVELAAKAVGVANARIAKSLSFMKGDDPIIVVVAGDARVDNHKFKERFGCKAKMLTSEQVIELIGHNVGGVCPFSIKDGVQTYLDVSMKRFETVFPACGSSNSAIELTCEELEKYAQNFVSWVDVCKDWMPDA